MEMIDSQFVADRITKLRIKHQISEVQLSLKIGMNRNYINNLVTQKQGFPSLQALINICDFFNISLAEFFYEGIDDPEDFQNIYGELIRLCNHDTKKILKLLASPVRILHTVAHSTRHRPEYGRSLQQ